MLTCRPSQLGSHYESADFKAFLLVFSLSIFASLAALPARPASAASPDEQRDADVHRFIKAYYTTFDSGHAHEITAMFDAPLYMMAPNGDVRVFETAKDVRLTVKKWKRYMIHSGFARTQLKHVDVRALTDDVALASTTFDRYSTRGTVYQRGGATYTLRRRDGEWRIYLVQIHPPESALQFSKRAAAGGGS